MIGNLQSSFGLRTCIVLQRTQTWRFFNSLVYIWNHLWPVSSGRSHRYALQKNTSLARELESNMYVDNILLTADNFSDAQRKYELTKQYFVSIKINLRQFKSNSEDFNNSIPKEDFLPSTTVKMLGISWNTKTAK